MDSSDSPGRLHSWPPNRRGPACDGTDYSAQFCAVLELPFPIPGGALIPSREGLARRLPLRRRGHALPMAVLTAPDEPQAIASPSLAAPVLRVRCDGQPDERAVALSTGKWTVGSSPQCQIQLPTTDVRPLQCLILLEANAATITRWASGVQLNGRDFSQAPLEHGDRLTIGKWEIEFDRSGDSRSRARSSKEGRPVAPPIKPAIDPLPKVEARIPQRTTPLLAPSAAGQTAVAELAASSNGPSGKQTTGNGVYAFEDRLVLALWTANHQARRRAKGLINGIRAARFQADAMAADLSAMETELDLARAAYDSQIGNDERLHQELAELRRQEELRVASLTEEIAALRSQLEFAQAALAQRTAEYEKLAHEAASLPQVAAAAHTSAVAEAQRAPFDQELTSQLALAPPSNTAMPVLAQELSGDVWGSVEPLSDTDPEIEQPPISWDAPAPVAEEHPPTDAPATPAITPSPAIHIEPATQTPVNVFEPHPIEPDLVPAIGAAAPEQQLHEDKPEGPAWAEPPQEQSAREYSSTSFIDKYRHLLEEDDSTPAAMPPGSRQPVIEEEFLSPAKAQTCASPADESDEALEAYMANMMRRVRSSSTSFASQAPPRVLEPATSSIAHILQSSSPSDEPTPLPTVADILSAEPISFEDLKLATRKVPLASDLAALREIANSTARTAIKTHVQRRSRESAITKMMVALTALVSAAYLMASAPALDNLQFWTGGATCVVGVTAAIQVLILERRRQR
jgi:hypothetical protein